MGIRAAMALGADYRTNTLYAKGILRRKSCPTLGLILCMS